MREYIPLKVIIDIACQEMGVDRQILLTKNRQKQVSLTKKIIYYFACYCTDDILADIGKEVAKEKHDLVIFGKTKIDLWLEMGYSDIVKPVANIKKTLFQCGYQLPMFTYKEYKERVYCHLNKEEAA